MDASGQLAVVSKKLLLVALSY